jgi:predicted lipoprotein with Yx(FWY)xxD motif
MRSRRLALSVLGSAALLGCGADAESMGEPAFTATPATTASAKPAAATGTRIVTGSSAYGRMLFNSRRQAIYIFQRDSKNKSNCYGECAQLWPPVYTSGKPRVGSGVRASLLGTIRRRDGRRQVTYAGKPLYYYVHEGPGQVLCHRVFLNGGMWWVVGPNGRRRP